MRTALLDGEVWKQIPDYSSYEVSSLGRVRSLDRIEYVGSLQRTGGHFRKRKGKEIQTSSKEGAYKQIFLYKDGTAFPILVHRLVMSVFDPIDHFMEVNHKNGLKHDNRLDNLEWCSSGDNALHSTRVLKKNRGESVASSQLKEEDVLEIVSLLKTKSVKEVAEGYSVGEHAIWRIKWGDNWSWLTGIVRKEV